MPQGHSVTAKTLRVPRTLRPGAVQPKPRRPAGRRARPHGGCGPSQATPPPLLAPRPRVLSVLHRASGSCRPPPHPAAWPLRTRSWHPAAAARFGVRAGPGPSTGHRAVPALGLPVPPGPQGRAQRGPRAPQETPHPFFSRDSASPLPGGLEVSPDSKPVPSAPTPPSLRPAGLREGWSPRPHGSSAGRPLPSDEGSVRRAPRHGLAN